MSLRAWVTVLAAGSLLSPTAASAAEVTLAAGQLRLREQGNLRDDGTFSFWTDGRLGDWFLADGGPVRLTVTCSGALVDGVGPVVAVEVLPLDGEWSEVGRLSLATGGQAARTVTFDRPAGFCGLRLRHLNRAAGGQPERLRHFIVTSWQVVGARLADAGPGVYRLFGDRRPTPPLGSALSTARLQVRYDPRTGAWEARHADGAALLGVRPHLGVRGLPIDLAACTLDETAAEVTDPVLGPATQVVLRWHRADQPTVTLTLRVGTSGDAMVAQLGLQNATDRALTMDRLGPVAADQAVLGGSLADWAALTDGQSNDLPCQLQPANAGTLEGWWFLALNSAGTRRSLVVGNLTNHQGLGRFLVSPAGDTLRLAAWSDYEGIALPSGATVAGEPVLIHFGRRGTDSLERLGDGIAAAHGLDLRRDHPLDTSTPVGLNLFTTWNSYGSAVVKGFDYHFDRTTARQAFEDPAWVKANQQRVKELGLQAYGYGVSAPIRGLPNPLARRYGQPDFWFKDAAEVATQHPDWYRDGRIDFSNPAVVAHERQRVAKAFAGVPGLARYSWDFTNVWTRLRDQHDPSQTSAQTYRAAMGVWRDAARQHPQPVYAYVWMNIVGFNYDRADVIHIGHDSDQGYAGPGCTFTHGLTRQISGRYWLNGRVWWNSPDSYHVFCGGLYSLAQARVHASFASLAGNLVHLGEPFTDQTIPDDRLDIIKRVSPTTADVARAVDVFEHSPARVWDLPLERPFGRWHVVGLFNVDFDSRGQAFDQPVNLADLGLDPEREYLAYEFWSQRYLGPVRGSFTRSLPAPGCEVISLVERQDHPVLVSTNRHVRQMAYDLLDLRWDDATRTLSGHSRVVPGDRYELRVVVPDGYRLTAARAGEQALETAARDGLLTAAVTPTAGELRWSLTFQRGG